MEVASSPHGWSTRWARTPGGTGTRHSEWRYVTDGQRHDNRLCGDRHPLAFGRHPDDVDKSCRWAAGPPTASGSPSTAPGTSLSAGAMTLAGFQRADGHRDRHWRHQPQRHFAGHGHVQHHDLRWHGNDRQHCATVIQWPGRFARGPEWGSSFRSREHLRNGYFVTYNGSATINGAGSVLNVPNLMQGYPAASNLTVSHGGALNAQSIIASTPINVLSGSSLTRSTSLTVQSTLTVGANSIVSTPSLQLQGES